ncbi:hypothetical protein BS78_05G268500 [Paspalum vaginatum]|nr:hypothetical protein BS78_05G268500 [Paspalum vaginatum]
MRALTHDVEDCAERFVHRVTGSRLEGGAPRSKLRRAARTVGMLRTCYRFAAEIRRLKKRVQEASARVLKPPEGDGGSRRGECVGRPAPPRNLRPQPAVDEDEGHRRAWKVGRAYGRWRSRQSWRPEIRPQSRLVGRRAAGRHGRFFFFRGEGRDQEDCRLPQRRRGARKLRARWRRRRALPRVLRGHRCGPGSGGRGSSLSGGRAPLGRLVNQQVESTSAASAR